MPVPPTRQDQPGMTLMVMQEHQPTTPQDFSSATNQSSGHQPLAIHGLVMAIHIVIGRLPFDFLPQLSRPSSQRGGEALRCIPAGKYREKPFHGPIPIGSL